jgi:hypothetical protein
MARKDAEKDTTILAGFRVVYVFDVSQTEPLEAQSAA